MRTLTIAIATSATLAFGTLAHSQGTSQTTPQSQTTPSNSGASPSAQSGGSTSTRSNDVNVRANIRTGSDRTVVREGSREPSVVYSRSRARHVTTVDERPSNVTMIKKKKYAKNKKRTRVYATAPSHSATIVERRRRGGLIAEEGPSRSRVISRDSGVNARVGVSTRTRTTTGSSSGTSTSTSSSSRTPSTTGSGAASSSGSFGASGGSSSTPATSR